MYDFYFGTREEIAQDEARYLLAIKRMTPRWINSIPDSEFLALAELLDQQGQAARQQGRRLVAVETGAGASTLALAFYAMKYEGRALSWDMNGAKGSVIRQVCVETMGKHFALHPDEHWSLVAFNSLSPHLGLPVLPSLVDQVDLTFHDSEHTWSTLSGELEAVMPLLVDGAVVAIDDGFLDFAHTNTAYVNTFRRKLGLPDVEPPAGNKAEPFYQGTERLLRERWRSVEDLADTYKSRAADDPWYAYYAAEFEVNKEIGLVPSDQLEHRFDSWRVAERLS